MHWVLQRDLFRDHEWDILVSTLERLSLPYSLHKVTPFVGTLAPAPQINTDRVICMGSYSMRHAAKKYGWSPGVYDVGNQTFEVQLEHWGDRMLNHDSVITPFGQVQLDASAFLRPHDDSKHFTGRIFSPEELVELQRHVAQTEHEHPFGLKSDTAVQVCQPKTIHAEYRFWVVDGQIVTRSLYKRGTRVIYSDQVDDRLDAFVEDAIATWQPHRAFCLDVCDTPEGIKIVEINTINPAGFYAGDFAKVIVALEEMESPAPSRQRRP